MWKSIRLLKGDCIRSNATSSNQIFYIVEGKLCINSDSNKTSEKLGKGDVFGELRLIKDQSSISIEAESNSKLLTIDAIHFLQTIEADPKIAKAVIAALLNKINESDEDHISSANEQAKDSGPIADMTQDFDPSTTHGRIMELTSKRAVGSTTIRGISSRAKETMDNQELQVEQFPFHICRNPSNPGPLAWMENYLLISDDPPYEVSQNHCRLTCKGSKIILIDDKSHFGTFVNGEHIGRKQPKQKIELKPGKHQVALGPSKRSLYQFEIDIS